MDAGPTPRQFRFEYIRPPDRRHSFLSTLLRADAGEIVLTHEVSPSRPLLYEGQEVMAAGYTAVWFLQKDAPYDIGRFYRPDGTWTGYYVDVLEPVRWSGADPETLQPIVDLYLDLWIAPDGGVLVLDEDELENAVRLGYITADGAGRARSVLDRLLAWTAQGRFPPEHIRRFILDKGE